MTALFRDSCFIPITDNRPPFTSGRFAGDTFDERSATLCREPQNQPRVGTSGSVETRRQRLSRDLSYPLGFRRMGQSGLGNSTPSDYEAMQAGPSRQDVVLAGLRRHPDA